MSDQPIIYTKAIELLVQRHLSTTHEILTQLYENIARPEQSHEGEPRAEYLAVLHAALAELTIAREVLTGPVLTYEELVKLSRSKKEALAEVEHKKLEELPPGTVMRRSQWVVEQQWLARQALGEPDWLVRKIGERDRLFVQHDTTVASGDEINTMGDMPVSIYLDDEDIREQVEAAVDQWLATADVSIDTRADPVTGSWFRRMSASIKKAAGTPAAREALLTATHVADTRLVQAQDAHVTAALLQNVGPVLQALQPTKDAVVRAGALLIVKIDWVVQVHQLTAAQQAILDHRPHLAASPTEIIAALQLPDPSRENTALQIGSTTDRGSA